MNLFQFFLQIKFSKYCLSKIGTYFFYALSVSLLCAGIEVKADNHFEIVAYPGVNEKTLSVNSLRSIFSMRLRTWPDGTKIRVFVLSDEDDLHQTVSKERLNVFPDQLRSQWDRLVYSGTGQAPTKVNSVEEMLAKVANTPGAIGYLWRTDINENVSILQIK